MRKCPLTSLSMLQTHIGLKQAKLFLNLSFFFMFSCFSKRQSVVLKFRFFDGVK